jgi:hypothetical protein
MVSQIDARDPEFRAVAPQRGHGTGQLGQLIGVREHEHPR